MKNRGLFVIVLISFIFDSAFASDPLWFPYVKSSLEAVTPMIITVIGFGVSIYLIPFAWSKVKSAISRDDNKIVSNEFSRNSARERLSSHGIGKKQLNLKSYRSAVSSDRFRKKFASFEDWQGSNDFRKTHKKNKK